VATGPGAIGNRTIGTAAAGGMLVGTVIAVLVIPGLYYWFGRIADRQKLIRDEADEPLSEGFEHRAQEAGDGDSGRLPHPAGAAVLYAQSPSERLKELRESGFSKPVRTVPGSGK
jgi:HAE1 family hydrophobic/amphiphilic exporter-1